MNPSQPASAYHWFHLIKVWIYSYLFLPNGCILKQTYLEQLSLKKKFKLWKIIGHTYELGPINEHAWTCYNFEMGFPVTFHFPSCLLNNLVFLLALINLSTCCPNQKKSGRTLKFHHRNWVCLQKMRGQAFWNAWSDYMLNFLKENLV